MRVVSVVEERGFLFFLGVQSDVLVVVGAGQADVGAHLVLACGAGPRVFGGVLPQCNLSDAADARARRDVDTLVIIDRLADLVTPMVTPLTYEGLVDEVMGGIHHGCARLPRAVGADDADETASAAAADADGDRVAYALNSRDALYAEVRALNIEELGARLGDRAKAIRAACDTA